MVKNRTLLIVLLLIGVLILMSCDKKSHNDDVFSKNSNIIESIDYNSFITEDEATYKDNIIKSEDIALQYANLILKTLLKRI